jgi:pimeloyl-ACP methyl ester carboxylesterase
MKQEEYIYNNVYLNGVKLEYIVSGPPSSFSKDKYHEPIVFIHGSMLADANLPLMKESTIRDRYFLISYHRRGFQRSKHFRNNNDMNSNNINNNINYDNRLVTSISQDAADCRSLMDYLGIKTAHVVGHSQGGAIALQFVVDYSDYVHSLSLLEPA